MLTDNEIQLAIKSVKSISASSYDGHHEHNDCIRIAYEWLDAQKKNQTKIRHTYPIKHFIERWAGRYVSTSDVIVAAYLHPEISGQYPKYNISSRLTLPLDSRLLEIEQANTMDYRERLDRSVYSITEE